MRGLQDTSLDTLPEKVDHAAEALESGREVMDAKQAVDLLRISESEFERMASWLNFLQTEPPSCAKGLSIATEHGSL